MTTTSTPTTHESHANSITNHSLAASVLTESQPTADRFSALGERFNVFTSVDEARKPDAQLLPALRVFIGSDTIPHPEAGKDDITVLAPQGDDPAQRLAFLKDSKGLFEALHEIGAREGDVSRTAMIRLLKHKSVIKNPNKMMWQKIFLNTSQKKSKIPW